MNVTKLVVLLVISFSFSILASDTLYRRDVQMTVQEKEVTIESKTRNNGTKDEMKFKISTSDDYVIVMEHKTESDRIETGTGIKIKFHSLVEYIDKESESSGYQVGEEIKTIRFGDVKWRPQTCPTIANNLYNCSATTQDGLFTTYAVVSSDIVNIAGTVVRPTTLKIGVIVRNFPFTNSNSKLALIAKAISEQEKKIESESTEEKERIAVEHEQQLSLGNNNFFSWMTTAETAGNRTINIIPSSLLKESGGEEGEDRIVFSFNATNPTYIHWDPKFGFLGTTPFINSASPLSFPVILGVCLIIVYSLL